MPRRLRYNSRQVIAALVEADGHQGKAAGLLDVSETTMSSYKRRWPEVGKACNRGKTDVRRRIALTLYELALGAEGWQDNPKVRQPDHTAAIFVMKTQGGWSEKTELSVEFTVIREAVAALEKAGLDPNTEFARMIQDAHATRNAADGGVSVDVVKVELDKMLARKRLVDGNGKGGLNGRANANGSV